MRLALVICAALSVVMITIAYWASKPTDQTIIKDYSVSKPIAVSEGVIQASVAGAPIPQDPETQEAIPEERLAPDNAASPEKEEESVEELIARTEHLSTKQIGDLQESGVLTTNQVLDITQHRLTRLSRDIDRIEQQKFLQAYKDDAKEFILKLMNQLADNFGDLRSGDPGYSIVETELDILKTWYSAVDAAESKDELKKLMDKHNANLKHRLEVMNEQIRSK